MVPFLKLRLMEKLFTTVPEIRIRSCWWCWKHPRRFYRIHISAVKQEWGVYETQDAVCKHSPSFSSVFYLCGFDLFVFLECSMTINITAQLKTHNSSETFFLLPLNLCVCVCLIRTNYLVFMQRCLEPWTETQEIV